MRQLKSADVFAALNVIRIIGAEEAVTALGSIIDKKSGLTQEEVGVRVIMYVVNFGDPKATAALYAFLSGPLEKSVQELEDMDAIDFLELLKEFISSIDVDRWKSFFQSLGELLRKS